MSGNRMLRITYVKSGIGYPRDQRDTLRSLGLRRLHQSVERPDTPSVRGMVAKVRHLVRVEEIELGAPVAPSRTGSARKRSEHEAA
jgi:large subunit ribosomal protein L30